MQHTLQVAASNYTDNCLHDTCNAMQQAQAEGLTLCVADNTTGYFGVYVNRPGKPFPFQARCSPGAAYRAILVGLPC